MSFGIPKDGGGKSCVGREGYSLLCWRNAQVNGPLTPVDVARNPRSEG